MSKDIFSAKQLNALAVWNFCNSPEEVARVIGTSNTTVHNWLKKDYFLAEVKALQKSATDKAMEIIKQSVADAAKTLVYLSQNADSEQVKANSAINILKCARVYVERSENINIDAIDTYLASLINCVEQEIYNNCDCDTADKIKTNIEKFITNYKV